MKFQDLQRFFSGEFMEEEKVHLLVLSQNPKGKGMLAMAIKEGWDASATRAGNTWESDVCLHKILKKIKPEYY